MGRMAVSASVGISRQKDSGEARSALGSIPGSWVNERAANWPNGLTRRDEEDRLIALLQIVRSRAIIQGGWKGNRYRRALAFHGLAAYGAPVFLNDSVDNGKPQSSALAHLFGGIERFEDFVEFVRRNPLTCVRKRNPDRRPV